MRISYRASAISLLLTLTALIAIESLLPSPVVNEPGVVCFDPRYMWRQVPWTERLSAIVWLGSFVGLMLFGLGNRRARWWATINLATLALNIYYEYSWTSSSCYTTQDMVLWSIWFAALAVVCLQHIFNGQSLIQN